MSKPEKRQKAICDTDFKPIDPPDPKVPLKTRIGNFFRRIIGKKPRELPNPPISGDDVRLRLGLYYTRNQWARRRRRLNRRRIP